MANSEKEIQKMELDFSQVTRTRSILSQNQVQKLWNSTPRKFQYKRPAKGGGQWDFVKVSYVRKVLDSVFGFNWDFEIETTLAEAFEVAKLTKTCVVKGTLTVKVVDGSVIHEIKKTQFGRAEVKFKTEQINGEKVPTTTPLDFGNDMKAASSDCLKKCASLFGIAADIYEKDEFMEITISGSEAEKTKTTNKKIKEAQKVLKAQGEKIGEENQQ